MARLRPRGADDLGLRQALPARVLPALVGFMVFIAALALGGAVAAAQLSRQWRSGAAALMTIEVPQPDAGALHGGTRAEAVAAVLAHEPAIVARRVATPELLALLRPWLGQDAATMMPDLPALFEVRTQASTDDAGLAAIGAMLARRLQPEAPGCIIEQSQPWFDRLVKLAESLRALAGVALAIVACVASAVMGLSVHGGLSARRETIETVHQLGATDGAIAHRFAVRVTMLSLLGGLLGIALCAPVLLALATLLAPFDAEGAGLAAPPGGGVLAGSLLATLPPPLWVSLLLLPIGATLIGWLTTQATVRMWLAQLP